MGMSNFINGDCMNYLPWYPDDYFDLAIVDPIYGDIGSGGYVSGKYAGKKMSKTGAAKQKAYHVGIWSQKKTGKDYFKELFRVSKNQIVWGGNYFTESINQDSQGWIVWDKKNGNTKYADCELAWTSFNRATRMFSFRWNGMLQEDMRNKEKRIHPTQKPVALYKWLLGNYASEGDTILDTHVGSASSLIACEQMGFQYTGFEVDETYYAEAVRRIEEYRTRGFQESIFDLQENLKNGGD